MPCCNNTQASYLHPSVGRQKKQELQSHSLQNKNHDHQKQDDHMDHSLGELNEAMHGPGSPTTDGSWWRVLTKRGPLEKGVANHSSIPALSTPQTVWKGEKT